MANPVLNRSHLGEYIIYGGIAGALYAAVTSVFVRNADFRDGWLMYVGNALFMFTVLIYTLTLLRKNYEKKRAVSMLFAGHLCTLMGLAVAVVLLWAYILIKVPSLLQPPRVPAEIVLQNTPPNHVVGGKTNGLVWMVMVNCLVGNFAVGSFISLLTSYAAKRNQTKDKPAAL